ncbi:phosphotransferase [Paenibacillus sp. FSL E2-0274]|uniref:phosphotransferase n=1 Tax=Paenibacillus TaxID=44249 RepID=UPI00096E8716|nr:phosphotransferase [Paenibacillus odorifer]OME23283.1 hypothetical protein BSK57_15795 [Paenibacillus odorifer]OME37328.1 hypothetical protein BSK63_03285 [Paenibacillus odorifer]OME41268.1 hypothetical protein BSK46_05895 [Paenibacillus odorifer]
MENISYNLKFATLCAKYNLGLLMNEPEPITGGLLHRMYRLQTDKAQYAVKALNPQIMQRDTAMSNYIFSEMVANLAYQKGIHAVPAIVSNGSSMHEVEGQFYLLFPWVQGKALPLGEIDLDCCKKIGAILAQLHIIDFSQGTDDHHFETLIASNAAVANWKELALKGEQQRAEWSSLLADHLHKIENWEALIYSSASLLTNHYVISHRDLDPKNVLWDEQKVPIIIDWEAAGPIHPTVELIDVALYWSGSESGDLSKKAFSNLINSYLEHGGEIYADWQVVLNYGFLGKLEWLAYNIRRSLGLESSDDAERELGTCEVIRTINALQNYADFIPQCLLWLGDLDNRHYLW